MKFDSEQYTVEELQEGERTIRFRAYRDLVYVERPVDKAYQRMHLFAPECYYHGESRNGYDLHSAPIFMPNQVGGYMPGEPGEPAVLEGKPNTIFAALEHGYVVAAPPLLGGSGEAQCHLFRAEPPRPQRRSFVPCPGGTGRRGAGTECGVHRRRPCGQHHARPAGVVIAAGAAAGRTSSGKI